MVIANRNCSDAGGKYFAPDSDQQVIRFGNAPSQTIVRVNSSFDFKVSVQRGIDWVEVPAASKEDGFLLVLKENKTGNPRACQLLVSTNEGRKFLYYVYQYEATDLLGVWGNSRIYVKWDTKNIENAYPLSATEISKNVDGEGYTIKMSLANTPAAQYLKDPAKATISLQATYEMDRLWFLSVRHRKTLRSWKKLRMRWQKALRTERQVEYRTEHRMMGQVLFCKPCTAFL